MGSQAIILLSFCFWWNWSGDWIFGQDKSGQVSAQNPPNTIRKGTLGGSDSNSRHLSDTDVGNLMVLQADCYDEPEITASKTSSYVVRKSSFEWEPWLDLNFGGNFCCQRFVFDDEFFTLFQRLSFGNLEFCPGHEERVGEPPSPPRMKNPHRVCSRLKEAWQHFSTLHVPSFHIF